MKFITEKSRGIHINEGILKLTDLDRESEHTFTLMPRAVLTIPKNMSCMDMLILMTNLKMMYIDIRENLIECCNDSDEYEAMCETEELLRDYAITKACDEVVSRFTLCSAAEKADADDAICSVFDELIEMKMNMPALFAGLLLEGMEE